eukprot:5354823-Pyramimonas_sp.AAC.1
MLNTRQNIVPGLMSKLCLDSPVVEGQARRRTRALGDPLTRVNPDPGQQETKNCNARKKNCNAGPRKPGSANTHGRLAATSGSLTW